tara:strand:- start:316 stop:459 length:144 start_codon:yes stop_codon:yes gene_type:complete
MTKRQKPKSDAATPKNDPKKHDAPLIDLQKLPPANTDSKQKKNWKRK